LASEFLSSRQDFINSSGYYGSSKKLQSSFKFTVHPILYSSVHDGNSHQELYFPRGILQKQLEKQYLIDCHARHSTVQMHNIKSLHVFINLPLTVLPTHGKTNVQIS